MPVRLASSPRLGDLARPSFSCYNPYHVSLGPGGSHTGKSIFNLAS